MHIYRDNLISSLMWAFGGWIEEPISLSQCADASFSNHSGFVTKVYISTNDIPFLFFYSFILTAVCSSRMVYYLVVGQDHTYIMNVGSNT